MILHGARQLPRRALLDANPLLNAAFVRGSIAYHAITQSLAKGHSIFLDEATWAEARRVVDNMRVPLQLQYDPKEVLEDFVYGNKIIFVPPSIGIDVRGVNRADQPLAKALIDQSGWLITDDHALISELHRCGLSAHTTMQVVSMMGFGPASAALYPLGPERPRALKRLRRHHFIRVLPGNWCGAGTSERHAVFDLQGRVLVYYDCATKQWVAKPDHGKIVKFAMNLVVGRTYAVCFSYDVFFNPSARGRLSLCAGSSSQDTAHSIETILGASLLTDLVGDLHLGSTRDGTASWDGTLRQYAADFGFLGLDTFKAILGVPELMPSLSTADILTLALPLVRRANTGALVTPTEADLNRFA